MPRCRRGAPIVVGSLLCRVARRAATGQPQRTAIDAWVNVSDWRPGSQWEHQRLDDARTVDIVGKVVESNPPRRLVFTWARPNEAGDASKHSRVAIDIEPHGDGLVRLTVTHEDLERDPQMLAGVSGGWPKVLSNLKTLLETGRVLPHSPPAT